MTIKSGFFFKETHCFFDASDYLFFKTAKIYKEIFENKKHTGNSELKNKNVPPFDW